LVTLAVPEACQAIVAGFEPSYMTAPLPSDAAGLFDKSALPQLRELISRATVVAMGPGTGRSDAVINMVTTLYRETTAPMVVDADGLPALATDRQAVPQQAGPRVLTPHPGEFARLVGQREPPTDRVGDASRLAASASIVVVLKGHGTVITDGTRHAINP